MKEKVTRYGIKLYKKGLPKKRFRAVFLSDMHNCVWQQNDLISLIRDEAPDLVLCGGDMLVAHPKHGEENLNKASAFIRELSRYHRIYYALGNHEYRLRLYPEVYGKMYSEYMDSLSDSDVVFLDNRSVKTIAGNMPVRIYGLSIPRKFYKRFSNLYLPEDDIRDMIGKPQRDKLNILMAHHPKYISSYFNWGADITLCGHYHGGVMQLGQNRGLISPDPSVFPEHTHGSIQKNGKTAIISAGAGEHTIPFRLHNPRELVVLDIENF